MCSSYLNTPLVLAPETTDVIAPGVDGRGTKDSERMGDVMTINNRGGRNSIMLLASA